MSTPETALKPPPDPKDALARLDDVAGFGSVAGFELLQRGANLLAASTLVPTTYQNNVPNCVIALNMAHRMSADPLMVMQNLYVVQGKPGWSAQFLIATFNQNGRFTALRYEWVGEKGTDAWGCRACAVEKSTGEKLVGSLVTIGLAKEEGWTGRAGSKWKTMPEQMLMYRSAAWFIRAYAPEIAMGLLTAEEHQDIVETTRGPDGVYRPDPIVVENLNSIVNGDVSAVDNAPSGSNAPSKAEAEARAAAAKAPAPLAGTPPPTPAQSRLASF